MKYFKNIKRYSYFFLNFPIQTNQIVTSSLKSAWKARLSCCNLDLVKGAVKRNTAIFDGNSCGVWLKGHRNAALMLWNLLYTLFFRLEMYKCQKFICRRCSGRERGRLPWRDCPLNLCVVESNFQHFSFSWIKIPEKIWDL